MAKVQLIAIGKTSANYLATGIQEYCSRLEHYTNFDYVELPDVKHTGKNVERLKQNEADKVRSVLSPKSHVVLLDEKGKSFSSVQFARMIEEHQLYQPNPLSFIIGGAFGFDKALREQSAARLSLSAMTFSHQMVRLFFLEQLYRAFTIINNESYHNE